MASVLQLVISEGCVGRSDTVISAGHTVDIGAGYFMPVNEVQQRAAGGSCDLKKRRR